MPLHIVRNDIVKMNTEAIVNTANSKPEVGPGCDYAIYKAAGYKKLLEYRKNNIGYVKEGDAFLTPGFNLRAKYIIHAVSPLFDGGNRDEEKKLRSCYKNSLKIAYDNNISSISFPLISTGSFGYPKKEGLRIAIDEINNFPFDHEMVVAIVVFDSESTKLGAKINPDLQAYIDENYVKDKHIEEYDISDIGSVIDDERLYRRRLMEREAMSLYGMPDNAASPIESASIFKEPEGDICEEESDDEICFASAEFIEDEEITRLLDERKTHMQDTFSEYLLYLIKRNGLKNSKVYADSALSKKTFSKIKNNKDYHPQKMTALCLCVGAQLDMDESKDLLARAGYALSPCDMRDIIFSFFIESGRYDIWGIIIQLEQFGIPCTIQ